MKRAGNKGVFSIDALVAMLPIMVIVFIGVSTMAFRAEAAAIEFQKGRVLDLLEASENIIRGNAVCENGICHYGWINGTGFGKSERYGGYSAGSKKEGENCIYRIAAYGENKTIAKVFVCRR
jgi:hypothetical protein